MLKISHSPETTLDILCFLGPAQAPNCLNPGLSKDYSSRTQSGVTTHQETRYLPLACQAPSLRPRCIRRGKIGRVLEGRYNRRRRTLGASIISAAVIVMRIEPKGAAPLPANARIIRQHFGTILVQRQRKKQSGFSDVTCFDLRVFAGRKTMKTLAMESPR